MKHSKIKYILLAATLILSACEKLVDVGPPKTSLVNETVFQTNDQATAAVIGLYVSMRSAGYASGALGDISTCTGLSSDELVNYNANYTLFADNQLTPDVSTLAVLYRGPYQSIFTANTILEQLDKSNKITPSVKAQLTGEALVVRAFNYFYLTNLFGAVPLQLNSDYLITQTNHKSSPNEVYQHILNDLILAEGLLLDTYPSAGKLRPNKSVAQAMLARTYLYLKDYINAEKYASIVISKTGTYDLTDFDGVFLANSKEAIWQLEPAPNANTLQGAVYIPAILTRAPSSVSLRNNFVINTFETGDKRKDNWIRSYTTSAVTYYYPFKYKVRTSTSVTEYYMVLRLAEQYLIRAEARINTGKTAAGITDLNIIRQRQLPNGSKVNSLAALSLTLSQSDALLALEQERKAELFTEWGHRWFDLKRLGKADATLSPIKSQWQPNDVLYPIPRDEVNRNPNITQNPGY